MTVLSRFKNNNLAVSDERGDDEPCVQILF
jgi:hypothetical protein